MVDVNEIIENTSFKVWLRKTKHSITVLKIDQSCLLI